MRLRGAMTLPSGMWKGTKKAKWEFSSRMRLQTYQRLKQQYDELRGRWMAGGMGRFGIKA